MELTHDNFLKIGFDECPHSNGYMAFFSNREIYSLHIVKPVNGKYTKLIIGHGCVMSIFDDVSICTFKELKDFIFKVSKVDFDNLKNRKLEQ